MADDDDETWLLDAGGRIIEKKVAKGHSSLSALERLTYCLWLADYGMRNAGDLSPATELHPNFLRDGRSAAQELGLLRSAAAFSLPAGDLERRYFELFDGIAAEIRNASAHRDNGLTA